MADDTKKIKDTEAELDAMVNGSKKDKSKDGSDEEDELEDEDADESEDEDDSDDDESEDDDESDDDEDAEEDDAPKSKKKSKKKSDSDDEDEESDEDDESDEDEDSEDEDEEDDEDDDEDEDGEDSPQGRKKDGDEMIPRWKMKAALRKQKLRFQKDVQKTATGSQGAISASEIVKKYGLSKEKGEDFVKDIIAATRAEMGISPDFGQRLKQFESVAEEQAEEAGFEKEWKSKGTTKALERLFPKASGKDLDVIKRKAHDLAFTKRYAKYSLEDIIRLNRKSLLRDKKKSIDDHKGGSKRGLVKYDLDNPDSIPWGDLSIQEFERVSDQLGKRSGKRMKIYRKGQRIG